MLARRLAAAATVALAAIGVITTSTAATAAGTKCVALVVDNADLGGGVQSSCAKVPQGATGYDVLRAGGHSFTICSNGVLGTIDGKPADGCRVKDNSHYWGYWHRAPGASRWTYSDEGAGTYTPRNASTEGWVWQNGASRQPTNVPYSSICKSAPTSTPTPTRSAAPAGSTSTPTSVARPSTHQPSTRRTATAVATPVATPALATPSPSRASASVNVSVAGAVPSHVHRMYRVPLGLVLALVVAVGLGAAAVIRLRR